MSEIIYEKKLKARKEHICDYCNELIQKGETYIHSTCKSDGRIYTWKSHTRCVDIACGLWNYVDPDDGMSQDDFIDACQEFCHVFICPDCDLYDRAAEDCSVENSYCSDLIAKKFETHELVHDREKPWKWVLKEINKEDKK